MRILIFTSGDHLYANFLLKELLRSGAFEGDDLFVGEQVWILPHKSKWKGVLKYLKRAGLFYVAAQVCKQYIFMAMRLIQKDPGALCFPYWKVGGCNSLTRKVLQDFRRSKTVLEAEEFHPDLILSLYSKEILPDHVIHIPKKGCLNLHPAPLPNYRGISPTFWVLAEGKDEIGCTLHEINSGVDTGDIVGQTIIETTGIHSEHALYMKCTKAGVDLVKDAVKNLKEGKELPRSLQGKDGIYRSMPTKKAVREFYRKGNVQYTWKELLSGQIS